MTQSRVEKFIETLDNKFRMISRDDLLVKFKKGSKTTPLIIDLRDKSAFEQIRIRGSVNIPIRDLPYEWVNMDKEREIIAVCNGSIQSGYAIYYLYINGFEKVFNLSGGFSGCLTNNFPMIEKMGV